MAAVAILILLTIVSLAISACGFYKFVYFFSLGYGFSISGIGITLLIYYKERITFLTFLYCLFLILYGLRLSGYLLYREIKSAAYRDILKTDAKQDDTMNKKLFIWSMVALLYVFMTAPITFILANKNGNSFVIFLGILISICGFCIESLADFQKNEVKKKDPKMFASEGLYKYVRCPNYFGEMVIWLGVFVAGLPSYSNFFQSIIALLGFVGIVFVMFSGARRLELRQDRNYGDNTKYKEYISKTPIIIPCVPIYSVKKYEWLVA